MTTKARFLGPFLLLGTTLAVVAPVAAQTSDPHAVQPERPSVATHAFTVAPGWAEIEGGAARESGGRATRVPLTLKVGLAPRAQLSLSTMPSVATGPAALSLDAVGLAIKWRIADAVPAAGTMALLPTLQVPVRSQRGHAATAGAILISSTHVGPVSLDLNAGLVRRLGAGVEPRAQSLFAVAGGGPIAARVAWGAEIFRVAATPDAGPRDRSVGALASATLTARPWLAVDVSATVGVRGDQPRVLQVGAVWNTGRWWGRRPPVSPRVRPLGLRDAAGRAEGL